MEFLSLEECSLMSNVNYLGLPLFSKPKEEATLIKAKVLNRVSGWKPKHCRAARSTLIKFVAPKAKLEWKILKEEDLLWVKYLKNKGQLEALTPGSRILAVEVFKNF
jgi:hypothetical protein